MPWLVNDRPLPRRHCFVLRCGERCCVKRKYCRDHFCCYNQSKAAAKDTFGLERRSLVLFVVTSNVEALTFISNRFKQRNAGIIVSLADVKLLMREVWTMMGHSGTGPGLGPEGEQKFLCYICLLEPLPLEMD